MIKIFIIGLLTTCTLLFSKSNYVSNEDGAIIEIGGDWISDLDLNLEGYHYDIWKDPDTHSYLIAGDNYILKIDKDGNLVHDVKEPFRSISSGKNSYSLIKVFDNEIYHFTSAKNSKEKIVLNVYDEYGTKIEKVTLDANFHLIDVIFESTQEFILLSWDWGRESNSGSSTCITKVSRNGTQLYKDKLSEFPEISRLFQLIKKNDGSYLFKDGQIVHHVSSNFEPINSIELDFSFLGKLSVNDDGDVYVAGRNNSVRENEIVKLNPDLSIDNSVAFENVGPDIGYAIEDLLVYGDHIFCLEQLVENSQMIRLRYFNFVLAEASDFIMIQEGWPRSKLIENELGGVTFLFGTKLYKLDQSCQLPDDIIYN